MAHQTYMTRKDEGVGEGLTDSIAWIFDVHIQEADNKEYNYAVLTGNEDAPEKIELWRDKPNFDTVPDRVWFPRE